MEAAAVITRPSCAHHVSDREMRAHVMHVHASELKEAATHEGRRRRRRRVGGNLENGVNIKQCIFSVGTEYCGGVLTLTNKLKVSLDIASALFAASGGCVLCSNFKRNAEKDFKLRKQNEGRQLKMSQNSAE